MTVPQNAAPCEDLGQIVASARRLGVEIDETEASQWLSAIAGWQVGDDVEYDPETGVFGHKVTMLDFSPRQLSYFREIGRLVEFKDQPGVVETALALSGSAAQSKIQSYPGDCDYFERVNVLAPTRAEACRVLAGLMREKALGAAGGPTYRLLEVKFGSYPADVLVDGKLQRGGTPIAWTPEQIAAGRIEGCLPDGRPVTVAWDDVAPNPGWCKLDWVVADPLHGTLANASNMLDVTWEAPDGTITPLDGYLDPYFQEVYLEAESVPIFTKLARHVSADALDDYVHQLEKEVRKYLTKDVNYGKAARRMYNVFRLTGRYPEAAFIRELFDEPACLLYQVWSLIRTVDDAVKPGAAMQMEQVLAVVDQLIVDVVDALEGAQEVEIVRKLLQFRDSLSSQKPGEALAEQAEAARAEVINIVNNFFFERLTALPTIKAYIGDFQI